MSIDSQAMLSCRWLCRWLLCFALMLINISALAESYQAKDDSLHTLFTALSVPLGLPVVVSRDVARTRISGTFDLGAAQQTLALIAEQQRLIWYSDGQAFYVYDAAEAKSTAVALRHISVDRLRGFMRRSGLDESSYPLRESGGRTFYVSGPPNYVDQVLHLAQLMDRQRTQVRVGAQSFGVVQVFNTHVADRQYVLGNETVEVPGMASMIEAMLAIEQKGETQRPPNVLADKSLVVMAYPDSNSLLVKGKPAQIKVLEELVAELDKPKRAIEVSLWRVDVDRDELRKMDVAWARASDPTVAATHVAEPLEDNRLMAQLVALERRRKARIVAFPVILTQENVPAVFQDDHTFYLPKPADEGSEWQPVRYGTQASVLPRFAQANQIEMQLTLEDDRQMGGKPKPDLAATVGRVGISTVVRVPQGRRLWVGGFRREDEGAVASRRADVRLFVIQARAVGNEPRLLSGAIGPPPLTQSQYERVQRAFVRENREIPALE
ncbi:EscC/YscC/HrcC family type III secretion system outer membrane ring protein [Pseudomonas fluorescens]|uniref:EscC/YscC/HrcC family type III secretion system outer membrane ring protein n=1 Tax=Pseudomonas fluorescens TaxID=294 RepID=A0A1T2Z6X0_PSEFL|nr:type III secretion system outer membrane ring subunit SctC [Pseudomonas fluorescens]OPA99749.1 EscC/YscC/HrcC family type III secretion system outer membrane ring protein [Pseudomonas fluorescens]